MLNLLEQQKIIKFIYLQSKNMKKKLINEYIGLQTSAE